MSCDYFIFFFFRKVDENLEKWKNPWLVLQQLYAQPEDSDERQGFLIFYIHNHADQIRETLQ